MNTKLLNHNVNPEYADLFTFKNENEEIEHEAQMISFRVLSEVEKACEGLKIKKKDLAEKIGSSKSYITQLFNGSKSINTTLLAKFEKILDATFEIKLRLNSDSYCDFLTKEFLAKGNSLFNMQTEGGRWYYCKDRNNDYSIEADTFAKLQTDKKIKQIA